MEEGQGAGPVERKLAEFGDLHGLVFGAFCEASDDVHNLIHTIAESRVASADLMRGQPGAEVREEMSVVVGQIRRRLSVAVARANAGCLISRLSHIGEGSRESMKRRQWRDREERLMRMEREAQWHKRVRGHGVTHRGEFFLP